MNTTIDFALLKKTLMQCSMFALLLIAVTSCDQQDNQQFVINEIMASNHSGIQAEDGELYDWIEIKNISNETASTEGLSLVIEKSSNQSDDVKQKSWDLPAFDVKPGECVLIFASKKDKTDAKSELHAKFKLPSAGGKIKIMKGNNTIDELSFTALEDDQCYRRLDDGSYETCYEPTPGLDNTSEAFEQYCTNIEKQRSGSLHLWELYSKGNKNGKAWVEIKNVSNTPVDLQDYYLTTSKKDMSQWQFPAMQLKPGEFYVVNGKEANLNMGKKKAVTLTHNGKFVDGICAGGAPKGVSAGRVQGKDGIFYFKNPTPNAENTTESSRTIDSQDDDEDEE